MADIFAEQDATGFLPLSIVACSLAQLWESVGDIWWAKFIGLVNFSEPLIQKVGCQFDSQMDDSLTVVLEVVITITQFGSAVIVSVWHPSVKEHFLQW